MRSLFLKIFLWFWLSVVLIGSIMVVIAAIMEANSETSEWQSQAFLAFEAARAVDIYERQGAGALKRHFENLPKRPMQAYLLDEHGTEVLGQKLPEQAIKLTHKEFDKSLPALLLEPGAKAVKKPPDFAPVSPKGGQKTPAVSVMAGHVVGPSGRTYTFLSSCRLCQ